MSKLEVLVTTMHQTDASKYIQMNLQTDVVIANQCDMDEYYSEIRNGNRIQFVSTTSRGTSRNRNIALAHASQKAEYLMFSDDDLGWLSLIECLKETGMSLKGIKQYIDWFREGDSTLPQRLEMFKQQQLKVLAQIEQFQKYLQKIDYKVHLYEEAVKLGSFDKAIKKFNS